MKRFYIIAVYLLLHGFAYGQADLRVVSFTVDTHGNNPVHVGTTITGTYTVQNQGNATAGKSHTAIYITPDATDPTKGYILGKVSLESINAGSSTSTIKFNYPIPYSVTSSGTYYIIISLNDDGAIVEPYKANNFGIAQLSVDKTAWAAQNLPYPIIFVHGLNSDNDTWDNLISDVQNMYGWGYGGNMNFCLNQDGDYKTSNKTIDYKDYNIGEPNLHADDFYTINFNVDIDGSSLNGILYSAKSLILQSNQSAILKQGLAVKDAIQHILNVTHKDKVILVGHSMGGLASREYLQNPNNWVETGNHHVAKLLTVGTPHGGSNAVEIIANKIVGSEAIRDLRTNYLNETIKGIYLFGGNEERIDTLNLGFNNNDINCDGNITKDSIVGLNFKNLPLDLIYSNIIGTGESGGDGVVGEYSANLNNFRASANADTFKIGWDYMSITWHTELPKQFEVILKGMDEPNYLKYAYNVGVDKLYYGNFTIQSNNFSRDDDNYAVNITSNGKLNIQVFNIPTPIFTISVYSDNNLNLNNPVPIQSFNSNGVSYLNVDVPVSAGKYYVVLSGIPTKNTWKSQYAFQLSLNTTAPTYSSCFTNLTTTTGSFSDGSGSSNYANNTDCSWLINPSGASSVTLRFNSFNTEANNDTVNVYDGNDNTYPLLGKFSGNTIPASITSTGSTMFVTFKTNGTITAAGWDATYTSTVSQNAQRVPTYTTGYKYWFDGDISNGTTLTQNFSNSDSVYTLLQTPSSFKIGFHTVSFMVQQSDKEWSAPVTNNFYYATGGAAATYEYWFDSNYISKQTASITNTNDLVITNQMLNATSLINGFHQFNIRYKPNGGSWSLVQSSNVFKQGNVTVAASQVVQYEYWFDNNYANKKTAQTTNTSDLTIGNDMLDASALSNGFHQYNYRFLANNNLWSSIQNGFVFKRGNDVNAAMDVKQIRYWFDTSFSKLKVISTAGQNGIINNLIDCSNLTIGKHAVNYQTMDNGNIWSSILIDSFTVVCTPPAAPTITSKNNTTFCQGLSDTLVSSVSSGNKWYLNDTAINGAAGTSYVATKTGNYTVTDSLNGCISVASSAIAITVNTIPATPIITSRNTTTFCQGGTDTLVTSASGGNQWYKDGTALPNETNTSYVVKATGSYTATTTANACISVPSTAILISVNPLPTAPILTSKNAITFCPGGTDTLVSSANSGNQWYKDGTALPNETNTSYVAKLNGSYTATATANGCTSVSSTAILITVNSLTATPTLTSKNAITFCQGGTDTLISSAGNGNQWYKDGITLPNETNTTYVASVNGSYTVTANSNGCTSAASTATAITVNLLPTKPTIARDVNNNLVSSSATGNQWFNSTGAIGSATNQTYKPLADGNYTVQVTQNGCASPNSDPYNYLVTAVININTNETVTVYPNPATDVLKIEFKLLNINNVTAELYDMNGIKLIEKRIYSGNSIRLSNYANGHYTLQLLDNKTHKFLYSCQVIKSK